MAVTHKVIKGETLSGIGAKYGIDWRKITGYRSGDPNLIYPGEVLTIPTVEAPKAPPIGGGVDIGAGVGVGVGEEEKVTRETDYRDLVLKALESYLAAAGKEKPWKEVYEEESKRLGIPEKAEMVSGIQKQVLDVEELLDKLEGDIGARISGKLVTEPQRRRYLATEAKPLREQLADLMRAETRAGVGLAGARGELETLMKLEEKERARAGMGLELLPTYKEALTYEAPEEKSRRELAEKIAEEKALKEAELGRYYKTVEPVKPNVYRVTDEEGNVWQLTFDPYTMEETGRVNLGKIGKGKEEKVFLTSTDYKKLAAGLPGVRATIPKVVADAIASALAAGDDLETIRTDLAMFYGKEKGYRYLDDFMVYIQKKEEEGGWGEGE